MTTATKTGMKYEFMPKTKTAKINKELIFKDLSSTRLVVETIKELWKRHSDYFWISGFWLNLAIIIWIKLGE